MNFLGKTKFISSLSVDKKFITGKCSLLSFILYEESDYHIRMERKKRTNIYPGVRIGVKPEAFGDLSLPIVERYSFNNPSIVYGIVISTERVSCTVNWDDNTISSVSKKYILSSTEDKFRSFQIYSVTSRSTARGPENDCDCSENNSDLRSEYGKVTGVNLMMHCRMNVT